MIDNFKRYWVQELWRKCEDLLCKTANYYYSSVTDNRLLITLDRELPESSHYHSYTMQDICAYITMNCGLITKKVSNRSFEILLDEYFDVYVSNNLTVGPRNIYSCLQLNEITTLHNTKRKNEFAINFETVVLQELFSKVTTEYCDLIDGNSKLYMLNRIGSRKALVAELNIPTQYYHALIDMMSGVKLAATTLKLLNVNLSITTNYHYQYRYKVPFDFVLHNTSVRMNDSYNLEVTKFSVSFPLDSELISTIKEVINSGDSNSRELAIAGIYDEPYKYMVNPFHQQLFKSLFHELP